MFARSPHIYILIYNYINIILPCTELNMLFTIYVIHFEINWMENKNREILTCKNRRNRVRVHFNLTNMGNK